MSRRRSPSLGLALALALSFACPTSVPAQNYPEHTVRIVVPFSAGSITDIMARIVADEATMRWGQPVIVENRPGPAGTASVANAKPDGHTLLLTANAHTVADVVNKDIAYDPIKDFAGVTRVASVPFLLIVNADLRAKDLGELIALAKAKPGTLNISFAGTGGSSYIATQLFRQTAGMDIVPVPYRGGPEVVAAVLRGDAHMAFISVNLSKGLIDSGKVGALAVATPARLAQVPAVPTFAEAGLKYVYDAWYGLLAPAGVPRPLLERINRDVVQTLRSPAVRGRFEQQVYLPVTDTPAEFDRILRDEAARYAQLLRDASK